jgi:hypothetical protein
MPPRYTDGVGEILRAEGQKGTHFFTCTTMLRGIYPGCGMHLVLPVSEALCLRHPMSTCDDFLYPVTGICEFFLLLNPSLKVLHDIVCKVCGCSHGVLHDLFCCILFNKDYLCWLSQVSCSVSKIFSILWLITINVECSWLFIINNMEWLDLQQ